VKIASGSIAAADAVGAHVGGLAGIELVNSAHQAFTTAMSTGMRVAGAVALAGTAASVVLLRRHGPVATASPAAGVAGATGLAGVAGATGLAGVAGATGLAGVAGGLEEAVLVGPMA
jgi:hypothetical protein